MTEATEKIIHDKLKEFIIKLCATSKKLRFDEDKNKLVFSYYKEYRNAIHEYMDMGRHSMPQKNTKMDRHKIAVAFLCAIIKARPIQYIDDNDNTDFSFLERTANEQLGFIFGLYLIELFNISDENISALESEIYELPIRLPECKHNRDKDYILHFTKLILDSNTKECLDFEWPNFNINLLFFLSHIFFLIDSFSFYKNYYDLDDDARKV